MEMLSSCDIISTGSILLSFSQSMLEVAKYLHYFYMTTHIENVDFYFFDILSGGADICNCKSSVNEWCNRIRINNSRQMPKIH